MTELLYCMLDEITDACGEAAGNFTFKYYLKVYKPISQTLGGCDFVRSKDTEGKYL